MKVLAVLVFLGVIACGDNVLPPTRIVGQVWSDDNGNGVRDPDEAPVAGATMFINLEFDPTINSGDPVAVTNEDGIYELIVPGPGTYEVQPRLPFGFRPAPPSSKRQPRRAPIIGGDDALAGEYGFMVSVGFRFDDFVFPFCGGVLIDDRHVVTAAHCSEGQQAAEVGVIAGTLDPFVDGQVFDVERITIHPGFLAAEFGNDIAVWTLAAPIALEQAGLTTVEMLSEETASLAEPGTLATTLGWGVSDRDSALLQRVHLPLVSAEDCAAVYPDTPNFETQICAGTHEGGVDSCQGDSGGPLLVRDDVRQVWMHAGVTSYGDGCAVPDVPGVYSRVSVLSQWVKDQVVDNPSPLRVTVDEIGSATTLDLAARSTTRAQVGGIDPRWQLTGITLPTTVAINTPLDPSFAIVTDTPTLTGFTCQFEPDLATSAPAQDVTCGLGSTEISLAGFPTGIFATRLTVTRDGLTATRRVDIFAGTPTQVDLGAALDAQDPVDPDFAGSTYHIDYYDVTGLSGTRAFAVDASSTGFSMFLVLYDLDLRDFVTGGGTLAFGTSITEDTQRLVVVPEAGRRYLIGVSSNEENGIGGYVVSILNDGTLTAH